MVTCRAGEGHIQEMHVYPTVFMQRKGRVQVLAAAQEQSLRCHTGRFWLAFAVRECRFGYIAASICHMQTSGGRPFGSGKRHLLVRWKQWRAQCAVWAIWPQTICACSHWTALGACCGLGLLLIRLKQQVGQWLALCAAALVGVADGKHGHEFHLFRVKLQRRYDLFGVVDDLTKPDCTQP